MSKDRAAPFSRKHRRYWIPVTGGMLLIGALNVAIGMCSYEKPVEPQRIEVHIPEHRRPDAAPGTLELGQIPADVMRAFNTRYPRTLPAGARTAGDTIVLTFPPGAAHQHATFRLDGTFVGED